MNIIIRDESSQYFKCGYSCDNAIVLSCDDDNFFITDSRYTYEAKEQANKNTTVIESSDLIKTARKLIRKNSVRSLVFDPKEWNVADFKNLKEKLTKSNLRAKESYIPRQRAIKSDEEISLLKKAASIGADAFDRFADFLAKNQTELDEKSLNFKAMETLTSSGERQLSFDPILAINENAAKPHAKPTEKTLKKGDLLLMDAGIKYMRYCSDRTRTAIYSDSINFSKEQRFFDKKMQKVYSLVLKAHDEAIRQVKIGMKAKELDNIAREIIAKGGFEKEFIHSLGHGVGLDIHEFPFINKKSDMTLEENMVFTIEPGIYIPGEFGVRIEDMIVLKRDGAHII